VDGVRGCAPPVGLTAAMANSANRNAIKKDYDLFDTPYTPCR
jgi:hypothetical protein